MKNGQLNLLTNLLNGGITGFDSVNLDWNRILSIADYSKVSSLLFYRIKDFKKQLSLPNEIYLRLKNSYQINSIRNTLILEEFSQLCALFKKEDIPLILLKGVFFLSTLYHDKIGIRRMEDIDILIKEVDREKAQRLLEFCGYRAYGEKSRKALMYIKNEKDNFILAPIHLHWHIVSLSLPMLKMNWSKIDMQDIWSACQPLNGKNGSNIFMMCPEHTLLALCSHGLSHGFARINILYDIHSYILEYRDVLDWPKLANLAKDWGLTIPLYIGLWFTQRRFHTDIPLGFLKGLRLEKVSILEGCFIRYVTKHDFPKEDICILLYLAINPRLLDKIKFLFRGLSLRLGKEKKICLN